MQIRSGPRQQSNTPLTRTGEDSEDDSLLDPSDHTHTIKNPSAPPPMPHSYTRSLQSSSSSFLEPSSLSRIGSISSSKQVELAGCVGTFRQQSERCRWHQRTYQESDLLSQSNLISGPPSSVSPSYR